MNLLLIISAKHLTSFIRNLDVELDRGLDLDLGLGLGLDLDLGILSLA